MSLNLNGFFPWTLNHLDIEVGKINRRNCKIVHQVKANGGRGGFLKNEAYDHCFLIAEWSVLCHVAIIDFAMELSFGWMNFQ